MQVTASVLRNLSWRADSLSREMLREVGAVALLTKASMEANKEATLKSILSALWNLSAHCTANKVCLSCYVTLMSNNNYARAPFNVPGCNGSPVTTFGFSGLVTNLMEAVY